MKTLLDYTDAEFAALSREQQAALLFPFDEPSEHDGRPFAEPNVQLQRDAAFARIVRGAL
jgi:hypothetical protein